MRTALRRARRLGAFLLIALAAGWVFLRRQSPPKWIEAGSPVAPAAPAVDLGAELGGPGEVPADVLATDAGLTELPEEEAVPAPSGTVVVDEVLVAELLADAPPEPAPAVPGEAEPLDGAPLGAETAFDAPTLVEPGGLERAGFETAGFETARTEPISSGPVVLEPLEDAAAAGAVAEVVAAEPVEAVVAEEPAAADAAGVDDPTDTALVPADLGIDEPTMTIARDAIAAENEETGTRIPMPTFSEAPTMEIPAVTDDLRAVRGIGPSMERMLHGLGIISFRQLAMLDGGELERVRAELSDFRTRIEREDWVGQARDLHKEKYGRDPS